MKGFRTARVIHIDLSDELAAVSQNSGVYDGVYLCFWYRTAPLGHCFVGAAELPLPPERLRMLASDAILPALVQYLSPAEGVSLETLTGERPLARLGAMLDSRARRSRPTRTVSVVICTSNRSASLSRCLESLCELRRKPDEVVVVDNAPRTSETRDLVAKHPHVRYVCEPRPGLSRARNAGIRNTTGEVIAFTDDDVVVSPDWLTELLNGFDESPDVMAVTGLVLPGELKSLAQSVFEQKFGFHRGYIPRRFDAPRTDVWTIGAGANMAIRRDAFTAAGLFDERLGAGAAGCSEDTELWYRLLERSFACYYTPLAVVHHFHRADLGALRQQLQAYMRGHVAALLIQFQGSRRRDNLRRLAVVLPVAYAKQMLRILILRSDMDARLWWSSLSGYLSGLRYLFAARGPRISDESSSVK